VADNLAVFAVQPNDADRVDASFRNIEILAVADQQANRLHPSQHRSWRGAAGIDATAFVVASRSEHRNAVVVSIGDVNRVWTDDHRIRVTAAVIVHAVVALSNQRPGLDDLTTRCGVIGLRIRST
jgi:hypothetical protein